MDEQWRDIPGYEGIYQISDQGRVKSLVSKGRILKLHLWGGNRPNAPKYYQLCLWYHRKRKHVLVHRLVGMAFLNLKSEQVIDHINRNTLDNRVANLRVCTPSQNGHNTRQTRHARGKYKGITVTKYGRWLAQINVEGKHYHLGSYATEEEAHMAYCKAALEFDPEFAYFGDSSFVRIESALRAAAAPDANDEA